MYVRALFVLGNIYEEITILVIARKIQNFFVWFVSALITVFDFEFYSGRP